MRFMKPPRLISSVIILALIVLIADHYTFHAQEKKEPKFKPAPIDAKGVKADWYGVLFDQELSVEDFEKELNRIMAQYGAELIDPSEVGNDSHTKIPDMRYALLRVPEARAKQIAEDKAVVSVSQEY